MGKLICFISGVVRKIARHMRGGRYNTVNFFFFFFVHNSWVEKNYCGNKRRRTKETRAIKIAMSWWWCRENVGGVRKGKNGEVGIKSSSTWILISAAITIAAIHGPRAKLKIKRFKLKSTFFTDRARKLWEWRGQRTHSAHGRGLKSIATSKIDQLFILNL